MSRPKTIFCDIDGTLVVHMKPSVAASSHSKMTLLKGTIEKLNEWDRKGYNIILVTGRKECMRKQTVEQLSDAGIIYDQLIMGIGGGSRVLINDFKKDSDIPTAYAHCVTRNKGIEEINV